MKRVKAIEKGYIGGKVREPGDEFEVDNDKEGTWFIPVKEDKGQAKKAVAKQKPSKADTAASKTEDKDEADTGAGDDLV